jgi:protein dithiol oxidoreductase (disulfide-forming)
MAKKKRVPPPKKSNKTMMYAGITLLVIIAAAAYISFNQPTDFLTDAYSFESPTSAQNTGAFSSLNVTPSDPGKVRIVEFMKFDCSHCNDLHKEMPQILKNYGDRVEIIYVPISFGGQSIKSIEAYLIAKEMGKGKEMRDALFSAKFESNRDVMGSMLVLKDVAAGIGLGPDFNSKLDSGYAQKAALKNNAYAGMYKIQGTPTVLINGKEAKVPDINATISSILG